MTMNAASERKILAAEERFSKWLRGVVAEKKHAALELAVTPGNPEPHLLFNLSEKEKI